MTGQASGHRWRNPQRLVNPGEVVMQEVQRNRRRVIETLPRPHLICAVSKGTELTIGAR